MSISKDEVVEIVKAAHANSQAMRLHHLKQAVREGLLDPILAKDALDYHFINDLGEGGNLEVMDYVLTESERRPRRQDLTDILAGRW